MNCKNCQEPLEEGIVLCPKCGADQTEPVQEETTPAPVEETAEILAEETVEEAPVEEIAEAPVEEVTEVAAEETVEEAPAAPKKKTWIRVVAIVCAVVLVLGIAAGVWYNINGGFMPKANDIHFKDNYTVSEEDIVKIADKSVATVGDAKLTNGQLQVQYWSLVREFVNTNSYYLSYFGLDLAKPLADQPMTMLEGDLSWEQYFLQQALDNWHCYQAIVSDAEAKGYEFSADVKNELDSISGILEENAVTYGYASVDEMAADMIGEGCTAKEYIESLTLFLKAQDYVNSKFGALDPTAEEIEAFVDANPELMQSDYGISKDSGKLVDVRHVLIQPEGCEFDERNFVVATEDQWEACRVQAQALLDEWKAGTADEESFGQLAMDYSVDGSASYGGLYTDVIKGKMVENFENWCFDESRQHGDSGLVRTEYGYHIMFYVGGEEGWLRYGKEALINDLYAKFIKEVMEAYPIEVNYKAIRLGSSNILGATN